MLDDPQCNSKIMLHIKEWTQGVIVQSVVYLYYTRVFNSLPTG